MQVNIINEAMRAASQNASVAAPAKPSGASFDKALDAAQADSSTKHFVEIGENLSGICHDYLKSIGAGSNARDLQDAIAKVAAANGLQDPNRIQAGSELDLSVLGGAAAPAPATTVVAAVPAPVMRPKTPISTGIRPDPLAAVAQGPLEPLPAGITPSQAALATQFTALGLREAPVAPSVPLVAAKLAEKAAEPLNGVGLLAVPGEGTSRIPAAAAIEKVVKMMESLVEPHKKPEEEIDGTSPWSQVLGGPAHLTSEFGIRRDPMTRRWVEHEGVDIAAPEGTTITPLRSGEVVYSGWQSGYGKMVVVRHDDGTETVYGHSSKLLVQTGQRVTEGTPLAEVGSTGRSTGPHLHFEVRKNGHAVDPIPYLTKMEKGV
jgi:murein DD-endopeptidase MepM/ murein hydrolase activator NlpD